MTFVIFVVVGHIEGDKFFALFCLFVVILNGLGIWVCYDWPSFLTFDLNFTTWCFILFLVFVPQNLRLRTFWVVITEVRVISCGYLEFWYYSHTRNESLDFINLNAGILSPITVCGEQRNTYSSCFTNSFMSFLLTFKGLQDITSGLKTMFYKIWCHNLDVGGILYNVHIGRGYMYVIVLWPYGVCTISGWYLSHVGLHMKSIIY